MKLATIYRCARGHCIMRGKNNIQQYRCLQTDIAPTDPKDMPMRYKYPAVYDPYGQRPPPSDKIVQLAEKIASLTLEERNQIYPTLVYKVMTPKHEQKAGLGAQVGAGAKGEEKKAEKTTFDVKLEKFDAASKLKVIKEIRSFTELGLKEAKDLVEKAPVILKQQVTKDEANSIIEKIKAVGGVAVME